ncbi:MAG: hypothetical protein ACRDZY_22635 [Acidimicrobiales bacterium]
MTELSSAVGDFLAHKRALGRKYRTEEATLGLLVVFACWMTSSPLGLGTGPAASTTS